MTKADRVREFLTERPVNGRGKKWDKRDLALVLIEKYPDLWPNWEAARTTVRRVTGSQGEKSRMEITMPEPIKFFYNGFDKWATENLNTEPAPFDEPFIIPSSITQLSIIADLHGPYLDKDVMTSFLRRTKDKTALLLNGDLMDSESLSRHLKGHNLIEYDKEIELCYQILKGLKQEFDHVYFKEGNHDFWLERYLLTNAREIFRLRGLDLKTLLRLGELGVHHIHNLKYIQYGDLDGVHGHEFPGFGMGKLPATGLLDKWQTFKKQYDVKILGSHSHRIDHSISKKSKDGKFGLGWVTGCMCRKAAAYSPYAGWDQGWAVATNVEGVVSVEQIKYDV